MRTMFLKSNERSEVKNKYIVHSRISEAKFREILWYFSSDIEAVKIAEFTNISEKTINKITKNIRILIPKECEKISKFSGEIKIDESYFGAKRVRGLVLSRALLATVSRRGYVKHRLSKFKGIFSSVATENFLLHLKECEFRYNSSKDTKQAKRSRSDVCIKELYHIVLKFIKGLASSDASRS